MSHSKFSGKWHNCSKQGHKATECWSGGKNTTLQPANTIPTDDTKTNKIVKREIEKPILV